MSLFKKKVLVVAAHSDDDALGCGGTLIKLAHKGHEIHTIYFTDGVSSRKKGKDSKKKILKRKKHSLEASKILGIKTLKNFSYPDNQLDTVPLLKITRNIENAINKIKPDILFTHYENDLNVDHQVIFKAVLTATRPKPRLKLNKIFLFETLSSTEWKYSIKKQQFNPNYFVDISKTINKKIKAFSCYKDEVCDWPHPRSLKGIKNLAMIRGQSVGKKFCEAFYLLREIND